MFSVNITAVHNKRQRLCESKKINRMQLELYISNLQSLSHQLVNDQNEANCAQVSK